MKKIVNVCGVLVLLFFAVSCNFFNSFSDETSDITLTGLSLSRSNLALSCGGIDYLSLSILPAAEKSKIKLSWSYDSTIIQIDADKDGVVVTGLKQGSTPLRVSGGGCSSTCIITVSGYAEEYTKDPYIYSSTSVTELAPGDSNKIYVSLYGGDASSVNNYTWTIDNQAVATLEPVGQYCRITAHSTGCARITVSNTAATYPYYIGVYVFDDNTKVSYLTTSENIQTLKKADGQKTVSVSMVNPPDSMYAQFLDWEIISDADTAPISILANGADCVLTPVSDGTCTIRVSHPSAMYPLDILCRVITIVENTYIEPSVTYQILDGAETVSISAALKNAPRNTDSTAFLWSVPDTTILDYNAVGDTLYLTGKKNGTARITVSHPLAEYSREILVVSRNQIADAVDASVYITTSQNYIRTKVGAEDTVLNILLKGGIEGDETKFNWSVKSTADDGTGDVIQVTTANGEASYDRRAEQTYTAGSALITPLKPGTAVITLSHPSVLYTTEVLVKVLSAEAMLDAPLYFSGPGILRLLNGSQKTVTVNLNGSNKLSSDDANIDWTCESSQFNVQASEAEAIVTANGRGITSGSIVVSHPKADVPKKILLISADTEEELATAKALYADKLYYSIVADTVTDIYVNAVGFDEEEPFSALSWTSNNQSVAIVNKSDTTPTVAHIQAKAAGTATITATYPGAISATFYITVYPAGTSLNVISPAVYFTTTTNVVTLAKDETRNLSVSAFNMSANKKTEIVWTVENSEIASIVSNGTTATITALKDGETAVYVSHPDSENRLKMMCRVGSEYELVDTPVVYISASSSVVTMTKDSPAQMVQATLAGTGIDSTNVQPKFSFSIDKPEIAAIGSQFAAGTCFIQPVSAGQAELTISHPDSDFEGHVLIVVGNTEEELAAFRYLTTSTNVVAVSEGYTKTVSVAIKNTTDTIIDGYTWASMDPSLVTVAPSGAVAVLRAYGTGSTKVRVTHPDCAYPLDIIVMCVDPVAAASSPYILPATTVKTATVSTAWTPITAELIGGSESDYSDFTWSVKDSNIAQVYGQGTEGRFRAVSSGSTYLYIDHPKAMYRAQVLLICDEAVTSNCYITTAQSVISLKPSEGMTSLTVSLANGSADDKYNFSYSPDVYDIVEFNWSANTVYMTPLTTGTAELTVSHPKAANDLKIVVKVSEYTSFSFGTSKTTLREGSSAFVNMQVPSTGVTSHVEYSSSAPLVATVTGTDRVCQVSGAGPGTATITAKLVSDKTGAVQATSDLLVAVEATSANVTYITSTQTNYIIESGVTATLAASLSGGTFNTNDSNNLKWVSSNPEIACLRGVSTGGYVIGQEVMVQAVSAGDAVITVSHEKSNCTLTIYIVVPGEEKQTIALNKTYAELEKGKSTTLVATISDAENSDYQNIVWTAERILNGTVEVVRILGSGKTVTLFGVKGGEVVITATLPNGNKATCTAVVKDPKSIAFEETSIRVAPGATRRVYYNYSPADSGITFTASSFDYFTYADGNAAQTDTTSGSTRNFIDITGIKEGTAQLAAVTTYGCKSSLNIVCSWDYAFSVDTVRIQCKPGVEQVVSYAVVPSKAEIKLDYNEELCQIIHNTGTKTLKIMPLREGTCQLIITAKNPDDNDKTIGTKTVSMTFAYQKEDINVIPKLRQINTGKYSYFDDGVLHLGDGEDVVMSFDLDKENANATITDIKLTSSGQTDLSCTGAPGFLNARTIKSNTDYKQQVYQITEGYVPTCDGVEVSPMDFSYEHYTCDRDGLGTGDNDWIILRHSVQRIMGVRTGSDYSASTYTTQSDFERLDYDATSYHSFQGYPYGRLSRKRKTELDGTIMSISKFRQTPWYFAPAQSNGNSRIASPGILMTYNISAKLTSSLDTTLKSSDFADTVQITIKHNNSTYVKTIPIYIDKRECVCTYEGPCILTDN